MKIFHLVGLGATELHQKAELGANLRCEVPELLPRRDYGANRADGAGQFAQLLLGFRDEGQGAGETRDR